MFRIGNLPASCERWLERILRGFEAAQNDPVEGVVFVTLHAEPKRLREGLTVLADGTDWDPGSGAGLYIYRSGAWVFLG